MPQMSNCLQMLLSSEPGTCMGRRLLSETTRSISPDSRSHSDPKERRANRYGSRLGAPYVQSPATRTARLTQDSARLWRCQEKACSHEAKAKTVHSLFGGGISTSCRTRTLRSTRQLRCILTAHSAPSPQMSGSIACPYDLKHGCQYPPRQS